MAGAIEQKLASLGITVHERLKARLVQPLIDARRGATQRVIRHRRKPVVRVHVSSNIAATA